jgi:hypothetical protein
MRPSYRGSATQLVQSYPDNAEAVAVAAAQRRLIAAAEQGQRRGGPKNGPYYGPGSPHEERIEYTTCNKEFDAILTRNHYGSLVLNARHALFIDVDVDASSSVVAQTSIWSQTFYDLCTVLESEHEEGFRIYRTAAGFRVLGTAHEFAPGSEISTRLMKAVGADNAFVALCGQQNSFRARLTPKPWRCGMTRPPFAYPRISTEHARGFAMWLSHYEHRCLRRATCRFLAHVGSTQVHERIAPIIEVHDRETNAHSILPLA